MGTNPLPASNSGGIAWSARRDFDSDFPALKPYLRPGMHVLDVGCGPGTITLGVAEAVSPGSVLGVDISEQKIAEATALAERSHVHNARFQTAGSVDLPFPDEAFDVTYSHDLIGFLREPVRGLREQVRVTKAGGWVVASYVDYGATLMYPPCPAFDVVWAAVRCLNDPGDPDFFANQFVGRELHSLLVQAGLQEVRLVGTVESLEFCYAGSKHFESRYSNLKRYLYEVESKGFGKVIRSVDPRTLEVARQELEAWHAHPHALHMIGSICAAGRV